MAKVKKKPTGLTAEQIQRLKDATVNSKKAEDATIDDIENMEKTISSIGYKLTEEGYNKFNKGSLDDFLDVWSNVENYIELSAPPPTESKKITKKEKPYRPKLIKVEASPKTIDFSRPKPKIRKPVEEEILDIKYTQGGDKVKVSTNFGEQVMSRKDYVDFYKKFRDKIQSFRTAKKVRRK